MLFKTNYRRNFHVQLSVPTSEWFWCFHTKDNLVSVVVLQSKVDKSRRNRVQKYVGVIYSMVHDLPNIGQIISIFVVNNKIPVLEVKCFSTVYIEHLRVYTLSELEFETMLITVQDLVVPNPVHIRTVSALPHSKTVILPFHINV